MDNARARSARSTRLIVFTAVIVGIGMVVLGMVYVDPHFPLFWRKMGILSLYGGLGVLGGAGIVHHLVRRSNRHDDPREAKPPSDPS